MKTALQAVIVNDVEIVAEYSYTDYRHATYTNPPEEAEIELLSVTIDGTEVVDLLSEWAISRIIEQITPPSRQEELEELAEHRFEQMREQRLFKD